MPTTDNKGSYKSLTKLYLYKNVLIMSFEPQQQEWIQYNFKTAVLRA